jgi:uncharacterized protein (TIGR02099 family)
MRRVLGRLAVSIWYLSALVLVIFASLVSLGQYYFPYLGEHKDEMLRYVSGELPFAVEMERLNAEWTGLAPTFHVEGLRLSSKRDPALTIATSRSSEVRIDIFRSLLAGAPRLRKVVLDNASLGFVESVDGKWHVVGGSQGAAGIDPAPILAFFLAIDEIELRRAKLYLRRGDGPRVETHDADLLMENFRHFRRLRMDAREENAVKISLILEARGDPRDVSDFGAEAYLRLYGADLSRLQGLVGDMFGLPAARVSGEAWARIEPGARLHLQADLSSPRIDLGTLARGRAFDAAENLDLAFSADFEQGNATVWLNRLGMKWYEQQLSLAPMRIDYKAAASMRHYRIAAEYLDVSSLAGVVSRAGLASGVWTEVLGDLSPYGGLSNALLDLYLPYKDATDFRFRARMRDLSVSPWRSAPGIRNAAGYLEIERHSGFAELDSGAISLEFPRVFDDELDFDEAHGRIDWRVDDHGWEVGSDSIVLGSEQTAFTGQFRFVAASDPSLDKELSLSIALRDGDATLRGKVVPVMLDRKLRDWLDGSLRSAVIERGSFFYRGVFGPRGHSRPDVVQLGLQVKDAELAYHPDWPPLRDLDAIVLVDGVHLRALASSGRVLGARLDPATVELRPGAAGSRLLVEGSLRGDLGDGLTVINDSPLTPLTGGLAQDWRGAGDMRVDLGIDIPLAGTVDRENGSSIKVRARLKDAEVQSDAWQLGFSGITGLVEWDLAKGLRSSGLDARLWNRPLRLRIEPEQRDDGHRLDPAWTRLYATGSVDVERLLQWLGIDDAGYLSGAAEFEASIREAEDHVLLRLVSDLAGVGVELPAPLGKSPEQTRPLVLEGRLFEGNAEISARAGDSLSLAMDRSGDGTLSGEIVLGPPRAPGAGSGLRLVGDLQRVDAGAWIMASQRLIAANKGRGSDGMLRQFRIEELNIDTADLLSASLSGLRLGSRWEDADFVLAFDSDLARGDFRFPADAAAAPLLRLEGLQLAPFLGAEPGVEPGAESPVTEEPDGAGDEAPPPAEPPKSLAAEGVGTWDALRGANIPAIRVQVERLQAGSRELGRWDFRVAADGTQFLVDDLHGEVPELRIGGLGSAPGAMLRMRWPDEGAQTELRAGLRFGNIEKVFREWGYDEFLESRKGSLDVALKWPGDLMQFGVANLSGLVDLSVEDGRLLQQSSNNPLLRALGVFSFGELLRRLKFDFKDLYKEGLRFDRIEGAIDLSAGTARTREPLELEGPSARMRFSGQTDLKRRTIDADLVVTLPIGSNLPWVAVLAGGLPAAAGVFVASQIFEKQLGKFSSAVYKVSGELDDPELEFVKVFDQPGAPEIAPKQGAVGSAATPEPAGQADRSSASTLPEHAEQ